MRYMLDTNICIYAIKNKPESMILNILGHSNAEIYISSITYAELMLGVEKSKQKEKNLLALILFLSPFKILDYGYKASEEYAKIRADLEMKGTPIGSMDMLIASHAKALNLVLVTNNLKEFKKVNALELEDWSI